MARRPRRVSANTQIIDLTSPRTRTELLIVRTPAGDVEIERNANSLDRFGRPTYSITLRPAADDDWFFNGSSRGGSDERVLRFTKRGVSAAQRVGEEMRMAA